MAYHNLRRKLEDALHGYLTASADVGAATLYRGMDAADPGGDATAPCIKIVCRSSAPMSDALDASSGATNRYVATEITVETVADGEQLDGAVVANARDAHDRLVGAVMDALHVDSLPAQLNAVGVAGLTVEQVDLPTEEGEVIGRRYSTRMTFAALCVATE